MKEVTCNGEVTNLSIVPNNSGTKFGVMDMKTCDLIIPFDYDHIDSDMSVGGILSARKEGNKFLIEIEYA